MRYLAYLLVGGILLCQCKKESTLSIEEQIQKREDCLENAFIDAEQIQQNLSGDWTLVGYGCGNCIPHETPKVTLMIQENTGVLNVENAGVDDTLLNFTWEIIPLVYPTENELFQLQTEPAHWALNMDVFCTDYMYFDDAPVDGLFMLYEKQ